MIAVIAALAIAAAPASPTALVKSIDAEVQKVLKSTDPSAEKLAQRADEFIDFVELSKRAMGPEWVKLDKKQQAELGSTMKGLLRASYAQKAVKDNGGGQAAVEYGAEKIDGNESVVNTSLKVKSDSFAVIYKLYRADAKAGWRIYDVVTDEVSLVDTYRDQFKKQLSSKGFDGLLKTLNTRRESLEKQNAELSAQKN